MDSDSKTSAIILGLDSPEADIETAGGKGASLSRLGQSGIDVPPGFIITTAAYRLFVQANDLLPQILKQMEGISADEPAAWTKASEVIRPLFEHAPIPADLSQTIRKAYRQYFPPELLSPAVAVRSSATAEDLAGASFAGQQETYLNIRSEAALFDAIKRCWSSLWTARAIGYRARQQIRPQDVSLALVVQELIPADAAGIMFTANPITGARDQVMINASWGLGEAIVSGMVTPDTIIADKLSGEIVSQEIADKSVMTVRESEGTREEPVPDDLRKKPVLSAEQVAELVRSGVQIEQIYGYPVDIEWVLQQNRIFIVQARPITSLPEPISAEQPESAAAEIIWQMPDPKGQYARSSVIELLPDPLTPLFATLAMPYWNAAMTNLMRRAGLGGVFRKNMLVTINGYAYYDYSMTPLRTANMLLHFPLLIPNVVWMFRKAKERWANQAMPAYRAVVAKYAAADLGAARAQQLLAMVQAIIKVAAQYYLTIQSGILPAAYMSEALFTNVYNTVFKRKEDPNALVFFLGYDSQPILAEKSLYDLAQWARQDEKLAAYLQHTPNAEIVANIQHPDTTQLAQAGMTDVWVEFSRRFKAHLERFGHAVYDLDFAKELAVDNPQPLMETLKYFLSGEAKNPYTRQETAAKEREAATANMLARMGDVRKALFQRLSGPAQALAPLREDALAEVGLGWPLIRRILGVLGSRLVAAGAIAEAGDIYFLKLSELKQFCAKLDAGESIDSYRNTIDERRTRWNAERKVTPPVVLPLKEGAKFMGVDFIELMPARAEQSDGNTLRGIGTSPGKITGVARVIHGPDEFDQMHHGDILVAKITTPAWTPLFALAAGVVTDVGGPLSHSSIVAREYHIPAVLGTGSATEKIESGQRITVDGDAGTVTVVE